MPLSAPGYVPKCNYTAQHMYTDRRTVVCRAVHAGCDEAGAGGQPIAGRDLHGHGSQLSAELAPRSSPAHSPPLSGCGGRVVSVTRPDGDTPLTVTPTEQRHGLKTKHRCAVVGQTGYIEVAVSVCVGE